MKETKYKNTEVGVIPEDWEVKPIWEISNPVRGGSPRPAGSPKYFNGNYIPWLTVAALTNIPISQLYVSETETFLTQEGSLYSRTLEKGTLIIANSGATLGVAKILTIKCCANDGIAALLDIDKEISPEYLVYFINTKTKYLREVVATGNGQPNLNTGLIGNIKFPLPPTLAEQTAIATALSDADALINSLEKLIAKKRNIKQGAMQQLLKPKEGWEVKKLGEIALLKARIGWQGLTTSEYKTTGEFILITGTEFKKGYIDWENCFYVDEIRYKQDKYIQIKENDVLVTKDGTIGKVALIKNTPRPATLNSGVFVIRPISNSFDPVYLYYVLLSDVFNKFLTQLVAGSTINHLYQKDFISFEFMIPNSIEEQTHIATILSDMDAEIQALETKLEKYRKIKQGMMQNLLTGKIRLK